MKIEGSGVEFNSNVSNESNTGDVKSESVDKSVKDKIKDINEKERKEALKIDQKMVDKSIDQANKELGIYNRRIDRSIHEKTHAMMYKIVDTKTDEVIKEFPPKKIQDMIAKMWELAGLFVDEEV